MKITTFTLWPEAGLQAMEQRVDKIPHWEGIQAIQE